MIICCLLCKTDESTQVNTKNKGRDRPWMLLYVGNNYGKCIKLKDHKYREIMTMSTLEETSIVCTDCALSPLWSCYVVSHFNYPDLLPFGHIEWIFTQLIKIFTHVCLFLTFSKIIARKWIKLLMTCQWIRLINLMPLFHCSELRDYRPRPPWKTFETEHFSVWVLLTDNNCYVPLTIFCTGVVTCISILLHGFVPIAHYMWDLIYG